MIRHIFFLSLILLIYGAKGTFAATPPVLLFSDLANGPDVGNSDDSLGQISGENGAIVTIWGYKLGIQENSTLKVGNKTVQYVYHWGNARSLNKSEESYRSLHDSHKMEQITFQIPANADSSGIVLTSPDGISNTLPFNVRAGNIYYIDDSALEPGTGTFNDPWQSPSSCINKISSGEDGVICYFREGVYANTEYAGTGYTPRTLFQLNGTHAGTLQSPNAFVGYPNEVASLEATEYTGSINPYDKNSDPDYYAFVTRDYPYNSAQYMVWSNLRMQANTAVAQIRKGWRFVGNLVIGGHVFNSGTGLVMYGNRHLTDVPTGGVILGNVMTGDRSGNKLNHAVYVGSSDGLDLGWNLLYDNWWDEGPYISHNVEDVKSAGYAPITNAKEHDNVIDMSLDMDLAEGKYGSRAFGAYQTALGSDIEFYNNLIIGPTYHNSSAIYQESAAVKYYNNTLVNVGNISGAAFSAWGFFDGNFDYWPEGVEWKNNIVYSTATADNYIEITPYQELFTSADIDSNLWYGLGSFLENSFGATNATNNVEANPLFVGNANYQLQINSPAIDTGVTLDSVRADISGLSRPQGSAYDIGAFEYQSQIRSDVDNSSATNTTDALLTLRNSLGLSMNGTAWQSGATTGDVNCDEVSNSTDALLILRYSLGLSMDGTSWCE